MHRIACMRAARDGPRRASRPGHDDLVSGPQVAVAHRALGDRQPGRVHDDAVELTTPHDLGVSGENRRAGLVAGRLDRVLDALEVAPREALLEDDGAGS